jgi:tetratricopeptide (TPR) repeat protein
MLSGKRFFYDEKFKLAIKSFNFLISEYPDLIDSSVHSFLAESFYELQGNYSLDVTSHVEKALYLNPSDTRALSLQGLNYFQQNNFEEALKSWSIALENSTNSKEKESLIIAMNLALKKLKN